MALWYCEGCTTAYAVGLAQCPHCRRPSAQLTGLPAATPAPAVDAPAAAGGGQPEPVPPRRPRRHKPPAEGGDTRGGRRR